MYDFLRKNQRTFLKTLKIVKQYTAVQLYLLLGVIHAARGPSALILFFKNSDFYFDGKKFEKKLVCYLTGQYDNVEKEFRVEFQSLIDECYANNIELKLNGKIIT